MAFVIIRPAEPGDLEPVLLIADQRRQQYAAYQPQFWNPAADALSSQRGYFSALLDDPDTLFVVATADGQIHGFLIAALVPTPPVYDPGGATCLVDDFGVDADEIWPQAGPLLLAQARSWARERGATQIVVITAGADEAKRALFDRADLSPASEWWVGST